MAKIYPWNVRELASSHLGEICLKTNRFLNADCVICRSSDELRNFDEVFNKRRMEENNRCLKIWLHQEDIVFNY